MVSPRPSWALLLFALAIMTSPAACASVLGFDPGTARVAADAADDDPGTGDDAGDTDPAPRRCANTLGEGIYCDDFDEPGRTDPGAREAALLDGPEGLELVTSVARSAPRSLEATQRSSTPRGFLWLKRTLAGRFHLRMAVRVARGATQNAPVIVAQIMEAPGAQGFTYSIVLSPKQERVELSLRQASTLLVPHSASFAYDEWHDVAMRFGGRTAYLELDGDSVETPVPDPEGAYEIFYGLEAYARITVFIDEVEIGTAP